MLYFVNIFLFFRHSTSSYYHLREEDAVAHTAHVTIITVQSILYNNMAWAWHGLVVILVTEHNRVHFHVQRCSKAS